jgi:hypothetical protein
MLYYELLKSKETVTTVTNNNLSTWAIRWKETIYLVRKPIAYQLLIYLSDRNSNNNNVSYIINVESLTKKSLSDFIARIVIFYLEFF